MGTSSTAVAGAIALVMLTIGGHASMAATVSPAERSAEPAAMLAASPAPTAVSARVTFDGATCAYTGPTVMPFPATLKVEFAPTPAEASSWIGILAIDPTATTADLDDPSAPAVGEGVPWFAYLDTHLFVQGSGTFDFRAVPSGENPMADMLLDGQPYSTFVVMCLPSLPGRPVGGYTFLHLVGPEENAVPSAASASLVP
jgi:hypothetical protein